MAYWDSTSPQSRGVPTLPIDPLARFGRNEEGAVAVIVALLLVVLLGFTALGVDVASLYRERARLQSVGDLTAVSAMAVPQSAMARATYVMSRNRMDGLTPQTLETGRYLRNPAIAAQDRFTPLPADSVGINAVRVVLQDDAALHFSQVFTEETHVTLDRTSLASRTGAASFTLGSHIARLGPLELDRALLQSFGGAASIDTGDMAVLAEASVNLGGLLEVLAAQTGSATRNPAAILDATRPVTDIVQALQTVLPSDVGRALDGLRDATAGVDIDVAALVGGIDTRLGLTATEFLSGIEIPALDVVRALVADQGTGTGIQLDADVTVPGILASSTSLTAGEPPAQSGWVALGEEGVQLHRAAVRLKTDLAVAPTLLGDLGIGIEVASLSLPVYTEVAGSTATLDRIGCNVTAGQDIAASFTTKSPSNGTSIASLYLGQLPEGSGAVTPADLEFADLLTVDIVIGRGLLLPGIKIPGVVIQAKSHVTVGTSQTDTVTFTQDDLATGDTIKTFGSGDLLSSAVGSLLSGTELRVKPGQSGLLSGLAGPVIAGVLPLLPGRLLSGLADPLDSVLDATLAGIGVELGAGELALTGHHCEPIRLVR